MGFPLITAGFLAFIATSPGAAANAPVTPGTITVERAEAAADAGGPDQVFADAVQAAILRANFIPLPAPSHSRYIAIVSVTRTPRGVVTSGTRGSGPAAGIANWGAGVSLRLPKKDDQLRDLTVTELKVTMLLRSDRHVVWSGRAVTAQVDGTRAGAPDAVAGKLADALLAQFPGQSDAPLSVP